MKKFLFLFLVLIFSKSYSQSNVVFLPEFNFRIEAREGDLTGNHSDYLSHKTNVNLSLKAGYKIFPFLYAGPLLGISHTKSRSDRQAANTSNTIIKGFFIGFFQPRFEEKNISLNVVSSYTVSKIRMTSGIYKYIELTPSLSFRITEKLAINTGLAFSSELGFYKKNAQPRLNVFPKVGALITLKKSK